MSKSKIDQLQDMVGESRKTVVDLDVEAGKVEEFANAIKDEDPVYRDADVATERGLDEIPAPMTFTRTALFPRYQPDDLDGFRGFKLGFDPDRRIHGEQEYQFERPVFVGDRLQGVTTLTDAFQKEGQEGGTMTFAVLETEFHDEKGVVVTERSTIIETGEDDAGE